MTKLNLPMNPNVVVDNEDERSYWCEALACTPKELREVLKFTDESPSAVRDALENYRKR